MKISGLSVRILVVLLTIPFILITANSAFAGGNPPTGGEKTKGPVVKGTLEFEPSEEGNPESDVAYEFTGSCKGQDVNVSGVFDEATFADVSEETLQDFRWDIDDLPEGCAPDPRAELIIRKIKSFVDMDPDLMKQAEVQMIFVVPSGK